MVAHLDVSSCPEVNFAAIALQLPSFSSTICCVLRFSSLLFIPLPSLQLTARRHPPDQTLDRLRYLLPCHPRPRREVPWVCWGTRQGSPKRAIALLVAFRSWQGLCLPWTIRRLLKQNRKPHQERRQRLSGAIFLGRTLSSFQMYS